MMGPDSARIQRPGRTAATPKRGKAFNIYLHDAQRVRIRELSAYLANEGLRAETPKFRGSTPDGAAG
jgi:hypothetical protein